MVGEVGRALVGANAYLGADALLPALADGADVLITGRVADPSLFLAPLRQAFGWAEDDWRGARRRHHGRPSDGVRRPGHRRLFRRSRLQGRAEPRLCGLSDRRGRQPTAAP